MILILYVYKVIQRQMYLIDTNIISEIRKKYKANKGVRLFFKQTKEQELNLFISVMTIGELRRGIELIRHRGAQKQAKKLEEWLNMILNEYSDNILDFTETDAQIWGKIRVPHYESSLDKQIAATALAYNFTLVTKNISDFKGIGVKLLNPFLE